MLSSRKTVIAAGVLGVSHLLVLAIVGTHHPGPILSNLVQLGLGIVCGVASVQAARRSNEFGKNFWRLAAIAFALFVLAQSLGTYADVVPGSHLAEWGANLIFFFWFTPMGMALFLDPESEGRGFDWIVVLDCTQAMLFGVAA